MSKKALGNKNTIPVDWKEWFYPARQLQMARGSFMFVVSLQSPENIYFDYKANHLQMPNRANSSWNETRKNLHCGVYLCGPVLPETVRPTETPSAHIHIAVSLVGPRTWQCVPRATPQIFPGLF